jgi:thiamine-phosphate pyrophosphorylase
LIVDAAHAGIDLIQIRERDLPDRELWELVIQAVRETAGTSARVIVNDRLDVALAARAAGVHLRGDSYPAMRARALAPDEFLIGRSVHSADEAMVAARAGGLDYVVLGTVFPSAAKANGIGVDELARAVRAVHLPVLAIGGITRERAGDVARAGAAGIAAIGMFAAAGDRPALRALVQQLRRTFDTSGCVS